MAEQNNFGKTALITGIVLGVLAGGYGAYTMTGSKVDKPQTRLNAGDSKAAASLAQVADAVEADRKKQHTIVDVAPEGATVNGKPRYTPIFFSPELWQVTLDAEQKTTVIDIYDPSAENVHGDVPNHWFISNGIADALGRSDGLSLDSDSDGFTNREEFDAETNPGDAASLPALIQVGKTPKLEVVDVAVSSGVISVDSTLAYEKNATSAGVRIFARPGETKPIHKSKDPLKVGDSFGLKADGSDSSRFSVLRFEQMEFTDSMGNKETETVMVVRDNVTAGAEKEFFIRAGSPTRPNSKDFGTSNAKGKTIQDTTVTMRVTAGPAAGKDEGQFKVQLNGSFTVPGTDITCVLETVDKEGTVNVRPNGAESPVNVPKAAK